MHRKTNQIPTASWSPMAIEKLRLKGCGLINCRSHLERRNPVAEEIQRIIKGRPKGK
jgi:hypothetical protein